MRINILSFIVMTAFFILRLEAARADFVRCVEVPPYHLSPENFFQSAMPLWPVPFEFTTDGQIVEGPGLLVLRGLGTNQVEASYERYVAGIFQLLKPVFRQKVSLFRELGRTTRIVVESDMQTLRLAFTQMDPSGTAPEDRFHAMNPDYKYPIRTELFFSYDQFDRCCLERTITTVDRMFPPFAPNGADQESWTEDFDCTVKSSALPLLGGTIL